MPQGGTRSHRCHNHTLLGHPPCLPLLKSGWRCLDCHESEQTLWTTASSPMQVPEPGGLWEVKGVKTTSLPYTEVENGRPDTTTTLLSQQPPFKPERSWASRHCRPKMNTPNDNDATPSRWTTPRPTNFRNMSHAAWPWAYHHDRKPQPMLHLPCVRNTCRTQVDHEKDSCSDCQHFCSHALQLDISPDQPHRQKPAPIRRAAATHRHAQTPTSVSPHTPLSWAMT